MSETVAALRFPYKAKTNIFGLHGRGIPATNVIANMKFKLAYVPIPKNACTALKILFFNLQTGREWEGPYDNVHSHFDYRVSAFNLFAEDADFFKFTVVRDPIARFVSAFNSRVRFYEELSEKWFLENGHGPSQIHAKFGARSLKFSPDIHEFISRLDDYVNVSTRIQHHFVPQYLFLQGRPEAFDKIYTDRQIDTLLKDLSERVGRPLALRRVQESAELDQPTLVSHLGPAERERLYEYYKNDYRILEKYL